MWFFVEAGLPWSRCFVLSGMCEMALNFTRWLWLAGLLMLLCRPAQAAGVAELLTLVMEGHPSLQSQSRLVDGAQAELRGANWQFYPTPSVSTEQVNAARNDALYSKDGRVTTFRLQQPVWTGGRLSAGVSRAEAAVAAAQAQVEESRQTLALRALQTWGEWKLGEQKVQIQREVLQAHEQLRDLIRRRVEAGLSAEADEVLAQSRLEQVRADLAGAQAQLAAALARFEQLAGQRLEPARLASFVVPPRPVRDELPALLERAWRHSPTALKLQAQMKQQDMELQLRKAQLMPEVYVRAEHQQGSYSATGASSGNRLFLGLSFSPGAGLSATAGIDAVLARQQAMQAEMEVSRRSLNEQVSVEQIQLLSLEARERSLRAGLGWTQAMVDSWARQFRNGRKTWVEVMNAARELAQAQAALADAEVGQRVAQWRLAVLAEGLPAVLAAVPASAQSARP